MEKNLNITNSSFSKHILSVPCRAVIKGWGPGFPPATMNAAPWLLSLENRRKIHSTLSKMDKFGTGTKCLS